MAVPYFAALRQTFLLLSLAVASIGTLGAGACVDRAEVGSFLADAGAGDGGTTSDGGGGGGDAATDGAGGSIDVTPSTTTIAAGGLSTCGVDPAGGVKCWGDNQNGTLGVGTFTPATSESPLAVSGLSSGVRAVAGGPTAHCAILTSGTARCWGNSVFGQILGSSFDSVDMPTPHDKTGLSNDVAQISFGVRFACALTTKGRAKCWGLGGAGQLGNGSTNDEPVARDIADVGEPLRHLSAAMGGLFACAATASGKVFCWGENGEGQLGTAKASGGLPVAVEGLTARVTAVGAGRAHACALYEDGGVVCWGSNAKGQLGTGSAGASSAPRAVAGVASATHLYVGGDHACAIVAGGAVRCWGGNLGGQLGIGGDPLAPTTTFPASFAAVSVAAGYLHTCAIDAKAAVSCLGNATRQQTGKGDFSL